MCFSLNRVLLFTAFDSNQRGFTLPYVKRNLFCIQLSISFDGIRYSIEQRLVFILEIELTGSRMCEGVVHFLACFSRLVRKFVGISRICHDTTCQCLCIT